MSNDFDEKLFEQIFGHTIETLANKLINTTKKKENQPSKHLLVLKTSSTHPQRNNFTSSKTS